MDFSPALLAVETFLSNPSRDARRIFHGRGRCYAGLEWLTVDALHPMLLITVFKAVDEESLGAFYLQLAEKLDGQFSQLAVQRRDQVGAPFYWVKGEEAGFPEFAYRGEQAFALNFHQQNHGYFLDMEPGRQWLETVSRNARVLNLFAYTCAFSVVAIAAGAKQVVNVDLSRRSLTQGRESHRRNDHDLSKVQFLGVDILKSWGKLKKQGPYDVVIVDPPSFQKGSFVATKDYTKVIRRLPELLAPDAHVLACLNAPELDTQFLKDKFDELAPSLKFECRLAASEDFPDVDVEQQLKLLLYKN